MYSNLRGQSRGAASSRSGHFLYHCVLEIFAIVPIHLFQILCRPFRAVGVPPTAFRLLHATSFLTQGVVDHVVESKVKRVVEWRASSFIFYKLGQTRRFGVINRRIQRRGFLRYRSNLFDFAFRQIEVSCELMHARVTPKSLSQHS